MEPTGNTTARNLKRFSTLRKEENEREAFITVAITSVFLWIKNIIKKYF